MHLFFLPIDFAGSNNVFLCKVTVKAFCYLMCCVPLAAVNKICNLRSVCEAINLILKLDLGIWRLTSSRVLKVSSMTILLTHTPSFDNQLAIDLVGGPVNPAPVQGVFSYTVIAGDNQSQVIQFRTQNSVLDMESLKLARKVYGQFVPHCTYHGNIGPLSVYIVAKAPPELHTLKHVVPLLNHHHHHQRKGHGSSTQRRILRSYFDFMYRFQAGANFTNRFFLQHRGKHRQVMPSDTVEAIHSEYRQKPLPPGSGLAIPLYGELEVKCVQSFHNSLHQHTPWF